MKLTKGDWGDVFAAVFLLALVAVLVRPSSLAPQFVKAFGDAMTGLISYAVAA